MRWSPRSAKYTAERLSDFCWKYIPSNWKLRYSECEQFFSVPISRGTLPKRAFFACHAHAHTSRYVLVTWQILLKKVTKFMRMRREVRLGWFGYKRLSCAWVRETSSLVRKASARVRNPTNESRGFKHLSLPNTPSPVSRCALVSWLSCQDGQTVHAHEKKAGLGLSTLKIVSH